MRKGRFVAFEGGEGRGKSTQARLLADELESRGREVALTREPGGTSGAEAIRHLLLSPPGEGWTIEAEALLFAAARADHVAHRIRPALEAGQWVICDRFLDSSRAYQAIAGGLGDEVVRRLHEFGSRGLLPDLTIVLDCSEEDVSERLQARDRGVSDAIGGREATYHSAVNRAFLDFAVDEPERFAVIAGKGSVEEVHHRVLQAVEPLLRSES